MQAIENKEVPEGTVVQTTIRFPVDLHDLLEDRKYNEWKLYRRKRSIQDVVLDAVRIYLCAEADADIRGLVASWLPHETPSRQEQIAHILATVRKLRQ